MQERLCATTSMRCSESQAEASDIMFKIDPKPVNLGAGHWSEEYLRRYLHLVVLRRVLMPRIGESLGESMPLPPLGLESDPGPVLHSCGIDEFGADVSAGRPLG